MAPGLGLNAGASSIELAPLSDDDIKAMPSPPQADQGARGCRPPRPRGPQRGKGHLRRHRLRGRCPGLDGDADDRTMQLEAASDFELEEADTGSEVFAIDEDDVDQNAATADGLRRLLEEDEDDDGFEESDLGRDGQRSDVESEERFGSSSSRAAAAPSVLAASGASAEWGGLWVGMLSVATPVHALFLAFCHWTRA